MQKKNIFFITDYKELANAMFALGFKVLLLSRDEENEYTVEDFIQYMQEIEFKGTFQSDYVYALTCLSSKINNVLKVYFKTEYLTYREDTWLPFKKSKIFGKSRTSRRIKGNT